MLQDGMIRMQTTNFIYRRGKSLYQDDNVKKMEISITGHELAKRIHVTGEVTDSGGRCYHPEVILSEEDVILNYDCHCPNADSYMGMCEHGTALCFHLKEEQRKQRLEHAAGEIPLGIRRETTEGLKQMMYQYTVKDRVSRIQDLEGAVELECSFWSADSGNGMSMECRVGAGGRRKLLIQNLVKFVRDVQEMRSVRYGKNLEFLHDRSAFTEQSRQIFDRLEECVMVKYPDYTDSYYELSKNYRTIELRSYMLDGFLDLFRGSTIHLDEQDIPVTEEDPRPTLTMKEVPGGAELTMDPLNLYMGQKHVYVRMEKQLLCCSEDFARKVIPFWKLVHKGQGSIFRKTPLFLNREDYGSFCGNLLPLLEEYVNIDSGSLDLSEYEPVEPCFSVYLTMPERDLVEATAKVQYEDETFDLMAELTAGGSYRNVEKEEDIRQILKRYFKIPEKEDTAERTVPAKKKASFEYGVPVRDLDADLEEERLREASFHVLQARGNEALFQLLERGLTELQSGAQLFVDDTIRRMQIRKSPRVNIGLSLRGDLLHMDVDTGEMDPEELYRILSAYRRRKKFFRLKNGDFIRLDESGLGVLADMAEGLNLTGEQVAEGHVELPLFRAMYLESALAHTDGTNVKKDSGFNEFVRRIRSCSDEEREIPEGIRADLRWYQREGFQWLTALHENRLGGILGDDMGLGKTLQMITFFVDLIRRGEKDPILVVAPASLIYNWEKEVRRFAPDLVTCVMAGSAAERRAALEKPGDTQIFITSYDMLKRNLDQYCEHTFSVCVLDEAQYIKNPGTQAAKAVKQLKAKNRFAMTGTPVENRPSDLWSIFDFLMPGFLYSYRQFRDLFEAPIVNDQDEVVLKQLQRMVTPFLLRRKKKDVLKDLPDKMEENIYVPMTAAQEKLYQASMAQTRKDLAMEMKERMTKDQGAGLSVLQQITRLCRLCDSPELDLENYRGGSGKVNACMDLMTSAVEEGHRILVFSRYTGMLELLQREWRKRGHREMLYLSGSDRPSQRQRMVEQFQTGEYPVFFISLKAGGTGLNLTAADMVLHCDPWWNEAARDQATDRAYRIGQTKDVNVLNLVTRNSIEERILQLQEKKASLADSLLSGEGITDARLNGEEIAEIFGLSPEDNE